MNRRTYMALLAAASAGCTGGDDPATESATRSPSPAPTPTATSTRTPTETATPTETEGRVGAEEVSESPTDEPTEAPTEEPTETPTEEPTEEPTATPTAEERAADHIAAAETHLGRAVDVYVGGGSWLGVDGSRGIDVGPIEDALAEAEDELDQASDYGTDDQQMTIANLRHLVGYVQEVADAHVHLHDAWRANREGLTAGLREEFESAGSVIDDAAAAVEAAGPQIEALRDDERPEAADATSVFSREAYADKIDLLATEQATAAAVTRTYDNLEDGIAELADATADYKDERYDHAAVKYWAAWNDFENGRKTLLEEPADAYADLVEAQRCFFGAVETAARELEAAAQQRGHPSREAAALDALESCDLVEKSPTASGLRDWLDGGR